VGFGGTAAPAKLSATLGRGLPGAKGGGGLPPHKRRAALRRGAQTRAGGAPCHRSAAHLAGVDAALQAEHGPMQLDESPNVCEHDGHEPLEEQSYYISWYQVSTNTAAAGTLHPLRAGGGNMSGAAGIDRSGEAFAPPRSLSHASFQSAASSDRDCGLGAGGRCVRLCVQKDFSHSKTQITTVLRPTWPPYP